MSKLPFAPESILKFAFDYYAQKDYKNALKLVSSLLIMFQPAPPLLALAASCGCALGQLSVVR